MEMATERLSPLPKVPQPVRSETLVAPNLSSERDHEDADLWDGCWRTEPR